MNKRRNKKTKDSKDKGLDENSQEAIEVNNIEEDNGEEIDEEPEEGIGIENENYDDYREIPELDKYEKEDLDDKEYKELSPEQRKKVDKILNEREQRRMRQYGSRVPAALLQEMDEEGEEDEAWRIKRRKMMVFGEPVLQED